MAVSYGTSVNVPASTGTNTGASPSITTSVTDPVVVVTVGLAHASATVSSLTITGFGGTASLVKATPRGVSNSYLEFWQIVAPTANTAGTVQANLSTSSPYQMVVSTFSGADQTDPCPIANAIGTSGTLDTTVTPSGLTADDAALVGEGNAANQNLEAPTNQIYLSNSTAINMGVGRNTGTSGVAVGTDSGSGYVFGGVRVKAAASETITVTAGTITITGQGVGISGADDPDLVPITAARISLLGQPIDNFGSLVGKLSATGNSQTNPSVASGTVAVAVGDLVYCVWGQQTGLTVGASTVPTDNLGNTYVWCNAGNDPGSPTARAGYSIVSSSGTLTTVSAVAVSSANNYANFGIVIGGPFQPNANQTAANPNNLTNDVASPYICATTGVLTYNECEVVCFVVAPASIGLVASSPNIKAGEAVSASLVYNVVGYQRVSETTSIAPAFTGATSAAQTILGTTAFKKADLFPVTGGLLTLTGQSVTISEVSGADSTAVTAGTVTITGKTVAETETLGVTQGTVPLTGQTVVVSDAEPIAVTAGTITLTGKTVAEIETIGITKGTVPLTGQTVAVGDLEPIAVTAGTITLAGAAVTISEAAIETISVTAATVTLTGQTVSISETEVVAVTAGTVTLTGQTVAIGDPVIETISVTAGNITLTGQTVSIFEAETVAVTAATVTLTGSTVAIAELEVIPVVAATVTLTGQAETVVELETVGITQGTITLTGKSVPAIDTAADTTLVDPGVVTLTGQTVDALEAETETVDAGLLQLIGQAIASSEIIAGGEEVPEYHGHYTGKKKPFIYDRPYLAEYAEMLRDAFQKGQKTRVEKLAEEIVQIAQQTAEAEPIENVAVKLRDLGSRPRRDNLALIRTLVLRAQAAERVLRRDEEDAEILLLM